MTDSSRKRVSDNDRRRLGWLRRRDPGLRGCRAQAMRQSESAHRFPLQLADNGPNERSTVRNIVERGIAVRASSPSRKGGIR